VGIRCVFIFVKKHNTSFCSHLFICKLIYEGCQMIDKIFKNFKK